MNKFIWIQADFAHAIHDRQLVEHGAMGLRDELQSVLGRPMSQLAYQSANVVECFKLRADAVEAQKDSRYWTRRR